MLDRATLRDETDRVRQSLADRGVTDVDLDALLEMDAEWRELKGEGDGLRAERNRVSERIGKLKREGADAADAIARSSDIKAELESVESRARELRSELDDRMLTIPQIPQQSVPVGTDETENVEHRREGFESLRDLPGTLIPHYDLGESLEIIDETRAAKTSGSGFYFLKGDGARLEHALIQFMLDLHREEHDYVDIFPPIPISTDAMTGTGQLPKFEEDMYKLEGEDLWLCPTAEVPVTNLYSDEILLPEDLPLKHVAYTPNFRREAGEHGTQTRGIVRVHQFNKVELVNFVRPEASDDRLEALLSEAETVLERLGLPYRILELCTGDLTFASSKTYDIEVWAPADDMPDGPDRGGRWLEVSSASNFRAFQARRAGLRYRPEHHEPAEYLHTLNASGLAIPRVMVAILEYYQNDDGTVTIPDALRPYLGGQDRIEGHDPVGEEAVGN